MHATYVTVPFNDEVVKEYKNNTFYFESGKQYDLRYRVKLDNFCPEGANETMVKRFDKIIKENVIELIGSKISFEDELLIEFPAIVIENEYPDLKLKHPNKEKIGRLSNPSENEKVSHIKRLNKGDNVWVTIDTIGAVKSIVAI